MFNIEVVLNQLVIIDKPNKTGQTDFVLSLSNYCVVLLLN